MAGFLANFGLDVTRRTVDVAINQGLFAARNGRYRERFDEIWRHAMICAHAAETLARRNAIENSAEMSTDGLLHDIGALCLTHSAMELEHLGTFKPTAIDRDLPDAVSRHHCVFGRSLLKRWSFPPEFIEVAQHHEHIAGIEAVSSALLTVHFADNIANWLEPAERGVGEQELLALDAARHFNISQDNIAHLREEIISALERSGVPIGEAVDW